MTTDFFAIDRGDADPSKRILSHGNWLQVLRIDTLLVATKMIQTEAIRDRAV